MANTSYQSINVTKGSKLHRQIENRASDKYGETFNAIANRDIERFYDLLEMQRRDLIKNFSENELKLILDASNGTLFDPVEVSVQNIHIGIEDAIEFDGLDVKWNVEGEQLIKKLSDIDYLTAMALIDFIEYFWHHHENLEFQPHKILREM